MTTRIVVVSSMATRGFVAELASTHERRTGVAVTFVATGGVEAARRVRAGEVFDVVVLAAKVMADLAREGFVDAASRAEVALSMVAAAVPAGRLHPALGDEAEMTAALLEASAIAYSTGPSGDHLLGIVDRLGLADALSGRLVQAPPGIPVASLLAEGRAELGFQQTSELVGQPGIELLVPLPPSLRSTTVFTAGVLTAAAEPDAARAFVASLVSPETSDAKRRHGLAPA